MMMNRRDSIKRIGLIAAGTAMSVSGIADAANIIYPNTKRRMKILAINGSARKESNTGDMIDLVLAELAKSGHEIEKINLAGEIINPCKACFACAGKRNCVWRNDIFCDLYDKMAAADVLVIGSPTYSADVSSTLKAVFERASVVSDTNPGMFTHKIGAGLVVGRRAGTMNALDSINHFFLNKEMFVAGSTYWNIAYGKLPGEALKDSEGVETMKNLGKNISWLLERMGESNMIW